jgi:hypothetical protein
MAFQLAILSIFSLAHVFLLSLDGVVYGLIGIFLLYFTIVTVSLFKKFRSEKTKFDADYQIAALEDNYLYNDHFYIRSKPVSIISSKENVYFEKLFKMYE